MTSFSHFRVQMIHEFYLGIQIMSILAILFFIDNLDIPKTNMLTNINIFLALYVFYIVMKLIFFVQKFYFQSIKEELHPNLFLGFLDGIFLTQYVYIMMDHLPIISHLFYFYIVFQIMLFHDSSFALFSTFATLCYTFIIVLEDPKLLLSYDYMIHIFLFYLLGYILASVFHEMSQLQNQMAYMYNELEQKNQQLSEMANRDYLTNMYNHKCFYTHFNDIVESSHIQQTPFSLALFDIDNFKRINDTYGHLAGDTILKQASSLILESIRKSDVAARYGGEEFAIIFPNTPLDEARIICERIRNVIASHPFHFDNDVIQVTISGGVSHGRYCQAPCQQHSFIASVDQLLYKAKSSGKNQIQSP
ncbi:GGDEF domain-containing protein [Anaerosolibacter sp.]|uniref:GGDEF domain-containing protein n=1 Tax=Anaerosolibacter sp. TaxID=1872527 RepID=UPI0039EF26C3